MIMLIFLSMLFCLFVYLCSVYYCAGIRAARICAHEAWLMIAAPSKAHTENVFVVVLCSYTVRHGVLR